MSEEYKRFTVSVPEELYEKFEEFREDLKISRSEGIRKAMHAYMLREEEIPSLSGNVVGCIAMIMRHEHFDMEHEHSSEDSKSEADHEHVSHDHEYSSKPSYANISQMDLILINDIQHHFADIIISTMHVHLEFEKCLEIIAVSGSYDRVKKLRDDLKRMKSIISIDFFVIDKDLEE